MSELLVFGADSLVGSHFVETTRHAVHAAGRADPAALGLPRARFQAVDLTREPEVRAAVRSATAPVIVNFAGATEVDAVERERPKVVEEARGNAYALNAEAPRWIAEEAARSGAHLIQISTDFIFDGTAGPYPESDLPAPFGPRVGWYGWTKGAGESAARRALPSTAVVRIAYPFRARYARKLDFARGLVARRKAGTLPPLFGDQRFTPTWIPDVSRAIEHLIAAKGTGTFHVASPTVTSPWEFGSRLFERVEGRASDFAVGSMADFLARPGATPRPRWGGLKVERLPHEGLAPTDWRDAIEQFVAEGGAA